MVFATGLPIDELMTAYAILKHISLSMSSTYRNLYQIKHDLGIVLHFSLNQHNCVRVAFNFVKNNLSLYEFSYYANMWIY